MSFVYAFATSSTVSYSVFKIPTSFLQKLTSFFNSKISSSSWSIAALKLYGWFERRVAFDWPAIEAPAIPMIVWGFKVETAGERLLKFVMLLSKRGAALKSLPVN